MQRQETLDLARRVRDIRRERFGEDGAPLLAAALDLPLRTWMNYELGITIPAIVLLRFLQTTSARAEWLLTGNGRRYRPRPRIRVTGTPA